MRLLTRNGQTLYPQILFNPENQDAYFSFITGSIRCFQRQEIQKQQEHGLTCVVIYAYGVFCCLCRYPP